MCVTSLACLLTYEIRCVTCFMNGVVRNGTTSDKVFVNALLYDGLDKLVISCLALLSEELSKGLSCHKTGLLEPN